MMLTNETITETLQQWIVAWNNHNLDNVLALFAPDAVFEHWTGARVHGVQSLRRVWRKWFNEDGDFYFELEDVVVDECAQKAVLRWQLHNGRSPAQHGVDVIHFKDGLITHKLTYSKTAVGESAVPAIKA